MSKIYVWIKNERGTEKTLGANEEIEITVNFGSSSNSKRAAIIKIYDNYGIVGIDTKRFNQTSLTDEYRGSI